MAQEAIALFCASFLRQSGGKVLKTVKAKNETVSIEMNSLPNGIYLISIRSIEGKVESFQFVKGN